ncbi:MAG TPA: UvrD-helicase domain-containing protein [Acidobacteriaceae bacterium]|nr:UvrD-helicase domain-containing protein [Acidobacteriaceae bacterium]
MNPLLEKMNPQQRAAVEATDGPVLILAGAGSGKTRVITHRIAYLIEAKGVAPDSILAVTFTNKASAEMGERVDKLLAGSTLAKPLLSTFHSFCVRVLRRDIEALRIGDKGLTRSFAIYDESDQQAIVKQAMRRMSLDDKTLTPRTVLSKISWAKNHMIDPQEYYLGSSDPISERVAQLYEVYRKELLKNNALDFDDLLLETVRLLKASGETRERYNHRFRYIMIDEYQDTNRPQYELMKLLAGDHHNICVVGDEDQSIYSWRGADIRNILEFEKDFPEAKTIRLEQNYRSTQVILEAASAVVARNAQRKGKNLWTERQGGSHIGYYEAPDGENEALFIADYIQKYLRKAGETNDPARVAVLYRTNSQSRLVEEALRRYSIQYTMVGGFSFYERAEIKDLLSYLKLVQNPHDSIALQRVINTPVRGIGRSTLDTLERLALETGTSTWDAIGHAIRQRLLPQRALNALEAFQRMINDAHALLEPGFAEKLASDVAGAPVELLPEGGYAQSPDAEDEGAEQDGSFDDGTGFAFGAQGMLYLSHAEEDEESFTPETFEDAPMNTPPADVSFNPFDDVAPMQSRPPLEDAVEVSEDERPPFRTAGGKATLPEVIRFINDRSGYIRALEDEGTPEAFSRIENLKELANAAQDAEERGETLAEFLDHAALVSDTDHYKPDSRVTLMTLHSAKGLEFPLVLLCGMEEGLFPHSRTLTDPAGLEEERRLCYVGMTRAMDTLILSRARYRRRYGNDMPDAALPSRFLEEVPPQLLEDLSGGRQRATTWGGYAASYSTGSSSRSGGRFHEDGERHYSYEDEDQSTPVSSAYRNERSYEKTGYGSAAGKPGRDAGSIDNIASFFAGRGGATAKRPKLPVPETTGAIGFKSGQRVRHPKYGDGVVFRREGDGDDAKITVQFTKFGVKKLVEKFAQLERV